MIDPRKLKAMNREIERLDRAFAVAMKASQNCLGEGVRDCSPQAEGKPLAGARAKTGTVPATADVPPGGFEPLTKPPGRRGQSPFYSDDHRGDGARIKTGTVPSGFAKVRAVRDEAELARRRAQRDGLGMPVENRAAELKVRAERRLGQMLECLAPRGGDHRSSRRKRARSVLAELDVTHNQSSRWRREAELSDREFEKYLADAKRRGERVTAADVLRLAEMSQAGNGRLPPGGTRS